MSKQMTLEQLLHKVATYAWEHSSWSLENVLIGIGEMKIPDHLNAAKGEAIGYLSALGYEALRSGKECRAYPSQPVNRGPVAIYTHPSSPDVVRDAMQFVPDEAKPELCAPISHEWLAKVTGHREGWNACRKEMLKRIDAAMSAREGGE